MIKIAICDDDQRFINNVKQHLDFYSNENNVSFQVFEYSNGLELLNSRDIFNIALLDVEMPETNGIVLGKELRKRNKNIVLIYITAHKKYLDEALNLNAARFFEKPIDSKRFYAGLDNAISRIDETTIVFYLKDNSKTMRIAAEDIIYVEIEPIGHRKTKVVTENNVYISSNKMSFWEEKLSNSCFIKTHKSFIVNLKYVTKFDDNNIELNGKYVVPLSRNSKASFHKNFGRFMAGV